MPLCTGSLLYMYFIASPESFGQAQSHSRWHAVFHSKPRVIWGEMAYRVLVALEDVEVLKRWLMRVGRGVPRHR